MLSRQRVVRVAVAALLAFSLAGRGGASPRGASPPEFQIDLPAGGLGVAMDAKGSFVVISEYQVLDPGSPGSAILARVFDSAGKPLGEEFEIVDSQNDLGPARIAMLPGETFLVIWADAGAEDSTRTGIFGRRFGLDGQARGAIFQVTGDAPRYGTTFDVAVDPSTGDFVVTWESDGRFEGPGGDIFAQRFDSSGTKLGGEFLVNADTAGNQVNPAAVIDGSGYLVVAWEDITSDAIWAQRFNAIGAPVGASIPISTTAGVTSEPSIAAAPGGGVVVVWTNTRSDNSDRVFARALESSGQPLGGEKEISPGQVGPSLLPHLVVDSAGNYVAAWDAQDDSFTGVFARRLDRSGAPIGPVFQVNVGTLYNQEGPAIAAGPEGEFVVVWLSGHSGQFEVDGRLYDLQLCHPGPAALCLQNGRFKVEATYSVPGGPSGPAAAVTLSRDTGYFWFFDSSNVEVVVKVLDACVLGRWWVFAGGLTNVGVTLRVTDMQTGEIKNYASPAGTAFAPLQDTDAFATCP